MKTTLAVFVAFAFLYVVIADIETKKSIERTKSSLEDQLKEVGELSKRMNKVEEDVRDYEGMMRTVISNEEQMIEQSKDLLNNYQDLKALEYGIIESN